MAFDSVRNNTRYEEFLPFSFFGYHSQEGLCILIPYTNLRDGDLELEELSRLESPSPYAAVSGRMRFIGQGYFKTARIVTLPSGTAATARRDIGLVAAQASNFIFARIFVFVLTIQQLSWPHL